MISQVCVMVYDWAGVYSTGMLFQVYTTTVVYYTSVNVVSTPCNPTKGTGLLTQAGILSL